MPSYASCPQCGADVPIPTMTNVSFSGNPVNLSVGCPTCGLRFDATGGGDGTFSTVGGRIRRVRAAVRVARDVLQGDDATELEAVKAVLVQAVAENNSSSADIAAQLESLGGSIAALAEQVRGLKGPDVAGWLQVVIALLGLLIAAKMLTAPAPVTDDDLEHLLQHGSTSTQ